MLAVEVSPLWTLDSGWRPPLSPLLTWLLINQPHFAVFSDKTRVKFPKALEECQGSRTPFVVAVSVSVKFLVLGGRQISSIEIE